MLFLFVLQLSQALAISLPNADIQLPDGLSKMSPKASLQAFENLEQKYQKNSANFFWVKFKKAKFYEKTQPEIFCKEMGLLSKNKSFILWQLSLIYLHAQCELPEEVQFNLSLYPDWLAYRAAEAFAERGQKFKDSNLLTSSYDYLAKKSLYKKTRVEYLEKAIALARKNNQDDKIKTLRVSLYKQAPRFYPKPQFKDYLAVAHDYRRSRFFVKALYYYKKILNSKQASFDEKNICYKWIRHIYKIRNFKSSVLKVSKEWNKFLKHADTEEAWAIYFENKIQLARDHWNFDRTHQALKILDEIIESPESLIVRYQAYWLRSHVRYQEGLLKESLRDIENAISFFNESEEDDENFLDKVLWKRSWMLRENNLFAEAINSLDELIKRTQNIYLKSRAFYWKGETERDIAKYKQSKKTFKALLEEYPYGYYGLLAHRRLGLKPKFRTSSQFMSILKQARLNKKSVNTIYWLKMLEEPQLLARFLKFKKKKLFGNKKKTKEDWIQFFTLNYISKNYLKIFQTLGQLDKELRNYFLNEHIYLFYPQEYKKDIVQTAKLWDVPKALVFALIRQESTFNKRARSSKDAFGLMQLIPSTARSMSRKIKQKYRGVSDLYIPEKNIKVGTYYLKHLLKKYQNSFILSVAAYNAGMTPVKRWVKELPPGSPLEFIENITYEETRTYVRILIRNFLIYNQILKEDEKLFPEWVFKLDRET